MIDKANWDGLIKDSTQDIMSTYAKVERLYTTESFARKIIVRHGQKGTDSRTVIDSFGMRNNMMICAHFFDIDI